MTTAHTTLFQRQASLYLRSGQHWHNKARARKHTSVYADPAAHGCSTRKRVQAQANKGFGRAKEAQESKKDVKPKKKKPNKSSKSTSPALQTNKLQQQFKSAAEGVQEGVQQFDEEFEARLKGLKQQTQRTLSDKKPEPTDEVPRNMYADPPPLSETLFGKKDEATSNPDEPSSFFNQAALTVGSLLLVVVFLVVSGGPDLANFAQPRKPPSQTRELSDDQKAQLKQQAQKYESQLASNAADLEALEGAGVSYAQLGDFKQAETLLAKLTGARPTDPEAWRLLVLLPDLLRRVAAWTRHIPSTANYRSDNRMFAETRFQLGDYKGTAAAYEKAMAVAPSIDLLQNLAAAYVNDGKPQAAIDAVKAAGQHLPSNQDELVALGYGDSELSLLLGRVYAQWPGHDGQALDIYDKGYLARGVLFRGEGRQGDAERMFLQARYIAPKESRALVDRVIGPSQ
ncbi:hypothetical protein ABBQ32_014054 [Trebouxia sp. C0010 RCD-2024]